MQLSSIREAWQRCRVQRSGCAEHSGVPCNLCASQCFARQQAWYKMMHLRRNSPQYFATNQGQPRSSRISLHVRDALRACAGTRQKTRQDANFARNDKTQHRCVRNKYGGRWDGSGFTAYGHCVQSLQSLQICTHTQATFRSTKASSEQPFCSGEASNFECSQTGRHAGAMKYFAFKQLEALLS